MAVARTSEKGFKKSTEQGRLWLIDDATGRLLPMQDEHALLAIVDRDSFYLATLSRERLNSGPDESAPVGAPKDPAFVAQPGARSLVENHTSDASTPGVLERLQAVIAERQAAMPEGSYTTHLFREGMDKIRKKTGEEAVELILARTGDEIVSESADLIYHLLVLLQASGLGVEAVLQNLAGRMK